MMSRPPEADVYRRNFPIIAKALASMPDLRWFADELTALHFIEDAGICTVHGSTLYEKASMILRNIETKFTASYEDTAENFMQFTNIFLKRKPLKKLGESLLNEYESRGGTHPRPEPVLPTPVIDEPEGPAESGTRAFESKQPTLQEFLLLKWTQNGKRNTVRIRDRVAPKWRDLGINLGFSCTDLDTIEMSQLRDVSRCASSLFGEWQRKTRGYNWKMLLEALEDSEFSELAREAEQGLSILHG